MKRILITGENSYIGNSFAEWVSQWPGEYEVDKISVRDNQWKSLNWQKYNVVINVAGVAHIKESKDNANRYYKVNRDLAIEIAKKAKEEKVSHIIQISSMSVFGKSVGIINKNTTPMPVNHYGKSKLEADNIIYGLQNKSFKVSIIRPPMVYGKSSPGNYLKLSTFVKKIKVFPKVNNQRSMIFIDNLSEFIKIVVGEKLSGIFYPQNDSYLSTYSIVRTIFNVHNLKLIEIPNYFNWVKLLTKIFPKTNKIFGNLTYDKEMSKIYDVHQTQLEYNITSFYESILKSEI